ncbi:MAG: hypothetical protein Q7R81_06820 [Candidatus Peregrinibacteria bacterium]|nr:hypothetical protein [Candidatus Peregrinibacteria bacterium]
MEHTTFHRRSETAAERRLLFNAAPPSSPEMPPSPDDGTPFDSPDPLAMPGLEHLTGPGLAKGAATEAGGRAEAMQSFQVGRASALGQILNSQLEAALQGLGRPLGPQERMQFIQQWLQVTAMNPRNQQMLSEFQVGMGPDGRIHVAPMVTSGPGGPLTMPPGLRDRMNAPVSNVDQAFYNFIEGIIKIIELILKYLNRDKNGKSVEGGKGPEVGKDALDKEIEKDLNGPPAKKIEDLRKSTSDEIDSNKTTIGENSTRIEQSKTKEADLTKKIEAQQTYLEQKKKEGDPMVIVDAEQELKTLKGQLDAAVTERRGLEQANRQLEERNKQLDTKLKRIDRLISMKKEVTTLVNEFKSMMTEAQQLVYGEFDINEMGELVIKGKGKLREFFKKDVVTLEELMDKQAELKKKIESEGGKKAEPPKPGEKPPVAPEKEKDKEKEKSSELDEKAVTAKRIQDGKLVFDAAGFTSLDGGEGKSWKVSTGTLRDNILIRWGEASKNWQWKMDSKDKVDWVPASTSLQPIDSGDDEMREKVNAALKIVNPTKTAKEGSPEDVTAKKLQNGKSLFTLSGFKSLDGGEGKSWKVSTGNLITNMPFISRDNILIQWDETSKNWQWKMDNSKFIIWNDPSKPLTSDNSGDDEQRNKVNAALTYLDRIGK